MNIPRKVFLIVSFVVSINPFNGSLIKIPNPSDVSLIDEAMVNVIRNCLPDVMNIFLGGQLAPETIKKLNDLNTFASINLKKLSSVEKLSYFHKKIDLLIINDTNVIEFLPSVEHSQFLNMSTNEIMVFVICKMYKINTLFEKNFYNLWKVSFLTVYAFCLNSKNKLKIITFNPYTNRTINKWEQLQSTLPDTRKKLGDRWTFYHRTYSKENICQGFEFDRNKYLDGYPVAAISKNMTFTYLKATVDLIEKALNVKVEKKPCPTKFIIDAFGRNDSYDFTLSQYGIRSSNQKNPFSLSQPQLSYSIIIVTHKRGLLTPLEKIYNYYGYLTVIATTIILAMTFVVIYLSKHDLIFVSFEIIRLLINTGIKTRIESNKSRIFFSMIFLYFLIIHGTFSGRLAGFLTKAEYRRNVEALEDLKDPRYKRIFAHAGAGDYINDKEINNKTIFGKFDCANVIRNNNSIACIDDYEKLLPAVKRFDLHTLKKPLHTRYYNYMIRKNWPLASRFNDLMIRCVQSGLSQKWNEDKIARNFGQTEITKPQSLSCYRPVSFDDLKFSFLLLGFGLTLSMISFFSEIVIQKKHYSKICREMKQVRIHHWEPKALVKFRIKKSFMKLIWYLRFKK